MDKKVKKIDTKKALVPIVVICAIILAIVVIYGVRVQKNLQSRNKIECQKQVTQGSNVCDLKDKNNMLFVGCNGFF